MMTPFIKRAVVSDVGVCHNEAVFADDSLQSAVFGADIDRHAFADCRACSNMKLSWLAVKLEVLRYAAYARVRMDDDVFVKCGAVFNGRMPLDYAPWSNFDMIADNCKWSNLGRGIDL